MTDQEIIQYANKNLWYLREGDYLPEPLSSINEYLDCWRGSVAEEQALAKLGIHEHD